MSLTSLMRIRRKLEATGFCVEQLVSLLKYNDPRIIKN